MTNQTYKKILILIIIANLLFFALFQINSIYAVLSRIVSVMSPVIIGICLAFILNIPTNYFEQTLRKVSKKDKDFRPVAIFITLIIFLSLIYLVISMIIPELISSITEINTKLPYTIYTLESFLSQEDKNISRIFSSLGIDISNLADSFANILTNSTFFESGKIIESIVSITGSFFSSLISIFIGMIFSIYILAQKELLMNQASNFIKAIFNKENSNKIFKFFDIVNNSFSSFIAGQGTEAVILAVLFFVSMSLLSIPKAMPISAILGVFSLVPIFGMVIACIYAVLAIFIVEPVKALWFLILFAILQQIEGNLIYPKVVGKSVGLPGLWVLFAITVIGSLFGFIGIIIAVPLMSVIYTLVSNFVEDRLSK